MTDKFKNFKQIQEPISDKNSLGLKVSLPKTQKNSKKKYKTVILTNGQLERGEKLARQFDMSLSTFLGYLIDHAKYEE